MKITSDITIDFPGLGFGIEKGEIKDAPKDKATQEAILANSHISEVKENKSNK